VIARLLLAAAILVAVLVACVLVWAWQLARRERPSAGMARTLAELQRRRREP
jgi:hypothetical protein